MARANHALMRLVRPLERLSRSTYWVRLVLREADGTALLGELEAEANTPRAFVIGGGARADLGHGLKALAARHLVVLTWPSPRGVVIRVLTLHADHTFVPCDRPGGARDERAAVGGLETVDRARVAFGAFELEVETGTGGSKPENELPAYFELMPKGRQLAFHRATEGKASNVVASIGGPAGGHAVPALVSELPALEHVDSDVLVLRARGGVHQAPVSPRALSRGVLVGRSRRCVLGRGFDENDGLSRLHALIVRIDGAVWALDLASRYGLRDVSKPARSIPAARVDDQVGCLVYGAGHLLYEP